MPDPNFAADIPPELARHAHAGTSHDPDKRGQQEIDGYVQTLTADLSVLRELADSDDKKRVLEEEFARYRFGYRERTLGVLAAKSRCVSTMVTGPSNFPVRRAQKASDAADARVADLLEFRPRALRAIRRFLRPEEGPIMSGDADALERLRASISESEMRQVRMKAANAAIRKHAKAGPEKQIEALRALFYSPGSARHLLKKDELGRIGHPDFEIRNEGANLRRMKKRLAELEQTKAMPDVVLEGVVARLQDCPSDNRVRLFFPGKPDEATRTILKRAGFRWTPSLECWQAFRNPQSQAKAREIAGPPVPPNPTTSPPPAQKD